MLILLTAAGVWLLLLGNLAGVLGPGPAASGPLAVVPEPRGTQPDRTAAAAPTVSIRETFDALPMDSALPEPWVVSGRGTHEIVALPTSVDRSIRLGSDGAGDPVEACRPTNMVPESGLRIALDYRLGRPPVADVRLLELRTGSEPVLQVLIRAVDGRITAVAGSHGAGASPPAAAEGGAAATSFDPASWRRIELTVSASGETTWQAHDSSGADAGSGTIGTRGTDSAAPDTLCLWSPAGSPAGWVAVDDLLIEG